MLCYVMLTTVGSDNGMSPVMLTTVGSDNGMSPGRRQAIIWTIGPMGTNFSAIVIVIVAFSFKKTHLVMSYGKWRSFCLGLNVLTAVL